MKIKEILTADMRCAAYDECIKNLIAKEVLLRLPSVVFSVVIQPLDAVKHPLIHFFSA